MLDAEYFFTIECICKSWERGEKKGNQLVLCTNAVKMQKRGEVDKFLTTCVIVGHSFGKSFIWFESTSLAGILIGKDEVHIRPKY